MDYQELIQLSTRGDEQALEDLFALAEKLSAEQKHEEAAKVFRESAISYRISASRNSGLAGAANGNVCRLNEEIVLIKNWIQTNPTGLRPLPHIVNGLHKEHIFKILGDEIWPNSNPDEQFGSLMLLLETTLDKLDGGYLPANSPFRRILYLMNEYFGLENPAWQSSLNSFEVRLWADQLADEVEKRFHTSQTNN